MSFLIMIRASTTIGPQVSALRSYVLSERLDAIEDSLKMLAPFFGRTPLALLNVPGFKAVAEYWAACRARKSER